MSARPLASLSATLLARPGQAKPAMRPQPFLQQSLDDLGWNDMGHAAQPAAAEPAPVQVAAPVAQPVPIPPVLVERQELARVATPAEPPVAPPTEPKRRAKSAQVAAGHRAAFTLRLDEDRHLRLRLASAVAGRSSQRLVVEALDAFLNAQPQVETLARQVPARSSYSVSGEKK